MNIGIFDNKNEITYPLSEIVKEEYPNCNVKVWNDMQDLKEEFGQGCTYKILFIVLSGNDREMVEYFARLQELKSDLKLIYVTEVDPIIFHTFYSKPSYILSKNLDKNHVRNALDRAVRELNLSREKIFTVINKQGIFTIPYTRIYYVESDKRKLNIFGHDGLIKSINLKISDFLRYEHGTFFLQCHKSYAVNLMHISQLEKYEILLENGMKLPISQSRYMETRAGYLNFLENE